MKHKTCLLVAFLLLAFSSCKQKPAPQPYDYDQIAESDTLRVITLNSSVSYFIVLNY